MGPREDSSIKRRLSFYGVYRYTRQRHQNASAAILAIFRGHGSDVRRITLVERRNVVGEYQVSLYAVKEGGFVLDLHPINASGTSPYVNFESCRELLAFLASMNLSQDLLAQVKALCTTLKAGHAFHQKMFLPLAVEEGLRALHGQAVEQLLCA